MAKRVNEGKRFEEDFLGSVPEHMYKMRIKDDTLHFKNVKNAADVLMFYKGKMFLLELKSTQEKSLPYGNIGEHQLKGLYESSQVDGVVAGLVINFRSVTETYFLEIDKALLYMNTHSRKSFPLEFVRQEGILINCRKKRVRYHYYVNDLVQKYC